MLSFDEGFFHLSGTLFRFRDMVGSLGWSGCGVFSLAVGCTSVVSYTGELGCGLGCACSCNGILSSESHTEEDDVDISASDPET